jgi:hypothetical protein
MRSWTAVVNLMLATWWDTGVTASRYDDISAWTQSFAAIIPVHHLFRVGCRWR